MRVPTTKPQFSEDWLDQFPDDMSMTEIVVSPTYVVNVAREVIAESAYGFSATSVASNVQLTSALLALLVASDWFDGGLNFSVVAGDAPSQKMIATAVEMSPRAAYGHGQPHVLRMDGAAEDMYTNMDVLSVRNRFADARRHLPADFDFNSFVQNLGGAFACAVSAYDVKGVC